MTIKTYIEQEKNKLKTNLESRGISPRLVIMQANENEGSNIYIRGKIQDCKDVGIEAMHVRYPVTIHEHDLIKEIKRFNHDASVDGILVQVPLPESISAKAVREAIDPSKDVDGFHPLSNMVACTPKGILDYLTDTGFQFSGKHAVIIGRSYIVGRPLTMALLDRDATVSVIHSKTPIEIKKALLEHADLICVAVGKKWFLSDEKIKPTVALIDIGINREDGTIYGDIKPGRHAAVQTPVPGGVGLLTRLSLLKNVVEAFNAKHDPRAS
jgi:methylenetetrahydrofolate dehydrogenase (NADP+)/methenyltetrahydrofolate cyclohydrolase